MRRDLDTVRQQADDLQAALESNRRRLVAEEVVYEGALDYRLCSASSATAMDAATRKSSRGSGTVTV